LYSAQPNSSAFSETNIATLSQMSKDIKMMVTEATRFGVTLVLDNSHFLQLLVTAIATCVEVHAMAVQNMEEVKMDRRKRGNSNKIANQSLDVRAILLANLVRWIDDSQESYLLGFETLRSAVLGLLDERKTEENQSRNIICSTVVPRCLATLASEVYSTKKKLVYTDREVAAKIQSVFGHLINGMVSVIPLTAYNQRRAYANAILNLSCNLSKEDGKKSLYRVAYAEPFKAELFLLKREAELAETIASCVPLTSKEDDE